MKINRLETHDRLLHFKNDQGLNIFQGANDCMTKNPLSLALQEYSDYVYLYAHPRTHDDGVTKIMFWQPRLQKPQHAELNSYLFRGISKSDILEIVWLLPPRETWEQYLKGKVTENYDVMESINKYLNHRFFLELSHPKDLSDTQCKEIYLKIGKEMDEEKKYKMV